MVLRILRGFAAVGRRSSKKVRVLVGGPRRPALARQAAPGHALTPAVPRAARAVHRLVALKVLRGGEGGTPSVGFPAARRFSRRVVADGGVLVAFVSVARRVVERARTRPNRGPFRPERPELRLAGDELGGRLLAVDFARTEPGVVRGEALHLGAQRVVVARQRAHPALQLAHCTPQRLRRALLRRCARVAAAAGPGPSARNAGSAGERAERRGRAGRGGARGVREDGARANQREGGPTGKPDVFLGGGARGLSVGHQGRGLVARRARDGWGSAHDRVRGYRRGDRSRGSETKVLRYRLNVTARVCWNHEPRTGLDHSRTPRGFIRENDSRTSGFLRQSQVRSAPPATEDATRSGAVSFSRRFFSPSEICARDVP